MIGTAIPTVPETETENETILIDDPRIMGDRLHPHHGREVICKKGTEVITIPPMVGGMAGVTYQRTTDVTAFGRAIFRLKPKEVTPE